MYSIRRRVLTTDKDRAAPTLGLVLLYHVCLGGNPFINSEPWRSKFFLKKIIPLAGYRADEDIYALQPCSIYSIAMAVTVIASAAPRELYRLHSFQN